MATIENLKPFGGGRSVEEERALQSKGGKNSGIARRRKRTIQQIAKTILDMKPEEDSFADNLLNEFGIDDEDKDYRIALMLTQIQKVLMDNDTKALQLLIDMAGENTQFNETLKQRKLEQQNKKEIQDKEYELHKKKLEEGDW